jgi:hypothetical protein
MKTETILKKGVLILPQLSLWSGRSHVKEEELGVKLPKGVTRGGKPIFPPAEIKEFATIKSQMLTAIEKESVKFGRGAYCMEDSGLPKLIRKLDELEQRWNEILQHLKPRYDRLFQEWLPTIEPAEWQKWIERAKLPADEALSKYRFQFALLRLEAPNGQDGANDSMVRGLVGQLWDELAEIAGGAADGLFGKERVTQKARGPFRRIAQKAVAVSFIDPTAKRLAGYIEAQLDNLPKTGPIEGSDLNHLQVLIHNLSDPAKAISLAKAFGASGTSSDFEEEDEDEVTAEVAESDEPSETNGPFIVEDPVAEEPSQKVFF